MAKRKAKAGLFGTASPKDQQKLDTTPVEMPLGYRTPTPLQDLIASMVREAVALETGEDFETPEEADDFEVEDEELLDLSPYEITALQDEEPIHASAFNFPELSSNTVFIMTPIF